MGPAGPAVSGRSRPAGEAVAVAKQPCQAAHRRRCSITAAGCVCGGAAVAGLCQGGGVGRPPARGASAHGRIERAQQCPSAAHLKAVLVSRYLFNSSTPMLLMNLQPAQAC